MVTYRKALPGEREAYVAFADRVFGGKHEDIHFEQFVPKVYAPGVDSARMHYLAVDGERGIVGMVGVMPGELCAGGEKLKLGYFGTVCVHPEARGEGHMKRLMAMALDDLRAGGADLALLNGQRQRYEHFGFAHGGEILRFSFSAGCVRHALGGVDAGGVEIAPLDAESPFLEAARALHAARPLRFSRGDAASFAVVCRTSMKEPWALSRRGEFLGYLIADRGRATAAEIAATSPEALDVMVKAWFLQSGLERLEIDALPSDCAVARRLAGYADGQALRACVNVRVFRHRRVLAALLGAKAGYARLADGRMDFDVGGERFFARVQDGRVEVAAGGSGAVSLGDLEASRLYAAPFDYDGRPAAPLGWFPLPVGVATPDTF